MEQTSLREMSLKQLTECGAQELQKYHRGESDDERYSLEILRRAAVLQDEGAWAALQVLFSKYVRLWFARHTCRQIALRYEPDEQTYIDDTFRRFWQAVSDQRLVFPSLAGAIRYLHLCLNCTVMDALRANIRPREERLPDDSSPIEPIVEDTYDKEELWEILKEVLYSKRERRLAYLLFHCNLKPREIMRYCPGEFGREADIYRIKRNIMDRLLRNSEKIRWQLDSRTLELPEREKDKISSY